MSVYALLNQSKISKDKAVISDKQIAQKQDSDSLVEIVDDNNRPIAVLPKDLAHRQFLNHRSVQVLIFNNEKKLYLQKRDKSKRFFPGRWDISARTHPAVGESTDGAAIRILRDNLHLDIESPQFLRNLPPCAETGYENVTIFAVTRINQAIVPNAKDVSEGYYFSREELTCLIKEFRELLTPNLVTLWESGLLTAP